jgi:hypothetical protein
MSRRRSGMLKASDGSGAVAFSIAAPRRVNQLGGLQQHGMRFLARAGLGQAVEAGARYATIYPRPSDSQITTQITANEYGMATSGITGPSYAHGTANGSPYVDITMGYSKSFNFGFFKTGAITFSYTRRAYQAS